MVEMATEKDVLDAFHAAGGTGGSAPSPTQCVTKSQLTGASLPAGINLSVTDNSQSNELVDVNGIKFSKASVTITWDDQTYYAGTEGLQFKYYFNGSSSIIHDGYIGGSAGSVDISVPSGSQYVVFTQVSVRITTYGDIHVDLYSTPAGFSVSYSASSNQTRTLTINGYVSRHPGTGLQIFLSEKLV